MERFEEALFSTEESEIALNKNGLEQINELIMGVFQDQKIEFEETYNASHEKNYNKKGMKNVEGMPFHNILRKEYERRYLDFEAISAITQLNLANGLLAQDAHLANMQNNPMDVEYIKSQLDEVWDILDKNFMPSPYIPVKEPHKPPKGLRSCAKTCPKKSAKRSLKACPKRCPKAIFADRKAKHYLFRFRIK